MKRFGVITLALALTIGLNAVWAGGETVELGGLTSKTPDNWKAQKPASNLRKFQFAVAKVEGDKEDGEVAIFYFDGGGGGVDENVARWKGQFIAPEGKTIDEVSKLEKFKVGKVADVVYLDISGTYKSKFPPNDPRAKEVRKENFRKLHAIFDTDKGPYFITLVGPAKTVAKNKDAFDGWIKAFK